VCNAGRVNRLLVLMERLVDGQTTGFPNWSPGLSLRDGEWNALLGLVTCDDSIFDDDHQVAKSKMASLPLLRLRACVPSIAESSNGIPSVHQRYHVSFKS
jgi:hypothetical protein